MDKPTPYFRIKRTALRPDALELVEEMAAKGCALATICEKLGINRHTWWRWEKEGACPELYEAHARGMAREHDYLVDCLHEKAKTVPAAAMFLLKARHGYREGEPLDAGARGVTVNINLPGALKQAQFVKDITATAIPKRKGKRDVDN